MNKLMALCICQSYVHLSKQELVWRTKFGHHVTARALVCAEVDGKKFQASLVIKIKQNLGRIKHKIPMKRNGVKKGVVSNEELLIAKKCFSGYRKSLILDFEISDVLMEFGQTSYFSNLKRVYSLKHAQIVDLIV